jgi:acetyl-CoA C-acetyltransferase
MAEALGYQDVVIIDGARTPIGRFGGSLKDLVVWQMGAMAIKGILARTGIDPELVDEVIMSHTRQDGTGTNPARNMMLFAGMPKRIPAHTVNMVCASGLKALHLAVQSIRLGETQIAVVGGSESMSNIPHILKGARWQAIGRLNNIIIEDGFLVLADNYCHLTPGLTAERASERHGITREESEQLGVESHAKAAKAWEDGVYDDEVFPIDIPAIKKGAKGFTFYTDECYRKNPSLEKQMKLPAPFKKDGTQSAGTSSGITDGAGAALIMSRKKAEELGFKPIAAFVDFFFYGLEPADFPDGPGLSIPMWRSMRHSVQ